jgi:hypothetical protein
MMRGASCALDLDRADVIRACRLIYRLRAQLAREEASVMICLVSHIRSNAIAYLALFVALGGTSYAAARLGPASVGTAQLRNGAVTAKKLAKGSVTPAKLDASTIGGGVRHWADVSASGAIQSSSSRAHVIGAPADGGYVISWSDTFSHKCAAIATPQGVSLVLGPSSGYANTHISGADPTSVTVDIYNAQGQPSPAAFSVAVIC